MATLTKLIRLPLGRHKKAWVLENHSNRLTLPSFLPTRVGSIQRAEIGDDVFLWRLRDSRVGERTDLRKPQVSPTLQPFVT